MPKQEVEASIRGMLGQWAQCVTIVLVPTLVISMKMVQDGARPVRGTEEVQDAKLVLILGWQVAFASFSHWALEMVHNSSLQALPYLVQMHYPHCLKAGPAWPNAGLALLPLSYSSLVEMSPGANTFFHLSLSSFVVYPIQWGSW